ncbi:MAG: indole-3-glycerol phosphate synthase TrpC [Pedobacter sp.]|nr:MAG: indole-3-glycerol phosphate synthase TrpC [Pedobacter sp.]
MSILEKIVVQKRIEIKQAKAQFNIAQLEKQLYFERDCYSLKEFLVDPTKTGIIAEFKRHSPSKGLINGHSSVEEVSQAYSHAGASAISILTDEKFFQGSSQDILKARPLHRCPILRKDFILDPYQIYQAKAWGADIILLIAAILNPAEILELTKIAKHLGLSVLLEVHNHLELERSLNPFIDAVGVNNRNLDDFKVDINTSFELAKYIPKDFMKVSESAINQPETVKALKQVGYEGFLIGELFMREQDPGIAMQAFVDRL